MNTLLPPLPGLRLHEQALAEKWEREKRERIAREVHEAHEAQLDSLDSTFQGVLAQAKQLCANKANWHIKPESAIECATCKSTGYLKPPLSLNNHLYRHAYPCPDCHEKNQERHRQARRYDLRFKYPAEDWLLTLGELPIKFEHFEELGLKPDEINKAKESLNRAFLAVRAFTQTCCKEGQLLTLEGSYGTAKTHLAAKAYRYAWLKYQFSVIFLSGQEFQALVTDFSTEVKKLDLQACDLLIIDESDRISVADKTKKLGDSWSENQLLHIVDARIKRRLSTMLIGNHISARLSGAIKSRLHAFGAHFINMSDIPDGRRYFGND